jgi:hypothetical protein
MANPATNKVSEDTQQGARPTEVSENERINLQDLSTGETEATENSENKRIATVVYP